VHHPKVTAQTSRHDVQLKPGSHRIVAGTSHDSFSDKLTAELHSQSLRSLRWVFLDMLILRLSSA
jgi:hypothetical protein